MIGNYLRIIFFFSPRPLWKLLGLFNSPQVDKGDSEKRFKKAAEKPENEHQNDTLPCDLFSIIDWFVVCFNQAKKWPEGKIFGKRLLLIKLKD